MRCCKRTRIAYESNVFRILGEFVTALGEDINFLNKNTTLFGYSEKGNIVLLYEPTPKGPLVDFEQYKIRHLPDINKPPPNTKQIGIISSAVVGVLALEAINSLAEKIELLSKVQELLQKIGSDQTARGISDPCEECCKKQLLSQLQGRKRVTEKRLKRIQTPISRTEKLTQ